MVIIPLNEALLVVFIMHDYNVSNRSNTCGVVINHCIFLAIIQIEDCVINRLISIEIFGFASWAFTTRTHLVGTAATTSITCHD
jgi:hypothetical protein